MFQSAYSTDSTCKLHVLPPYTVDCLCLPSSVWSRKLERRQNKVRSELEMSLLHRVFVYGTLKLGQPNNHVMTTGKEGRARLLGAGHTKVRFPLVIASPFNAPFCLNKPGVGEHLVGELYEVDDDLLAFLDRMENVPTLYERHTKTVVTDDQNEVDAQMYILCNYKDALTELPYFRDYDSKGPHNLPYIPRNLRDESKSIFEVLKSGESGLTDYSL